jgi:hypothetical protein
MGALINQSESDFAAVFRVIFGGQLMSAAGFTWFSRQYK